MSAGCNKPASTCAAELDKPSQLQESKPWRAPLHASKEHPQQSTTTLCHILEEEVATTVTSCKTERLPEQRADSGKQREKSWKQELVADSPLNSSGKAVAPVLYPAKKSFKTLKLCEHQRRKRDCKDCGGSGICKHQRRRRRCKACGGSEICKHQQQRSECRACNGGEICEHQRMRSRCKACREVQSKATEIGKGQARKQEI